MLDDGIGNVDTEMAAQSSGLPRVFTPISAPVVRRIDPVRDVRFIVDRERY